MNFSTVKNTLHDLNVLLEELSDEQYTIVIAHLGGSTVGEHVRHIIELFDCLLSSYNDGVLDYDNRKRDKKIQTQREFAAKKVCIIINEIEKQNKELKLDCFIFGSVVGIKTNYQREVLYNLEHCIHHQALIKVAIYQFENISVKETFGVAPSTIEFRKICAQ